MRTINQIVQDLIAHGFTQKYIAEEVGVSQPVISDLFRDVQKDIGYERAGKKLEALHRSTFPSQYSSEEPVNKYNRAKVRRKADRQDRRYTGPKAGA